MSEMKQTEHGVCRRRRWPSYSYTNTTHELLPETERATGRIENYNLRVAGAAVASLDAAFACSCVKLVGVRIRPPSMRPDASLTSEELVCLSRSITS